MSERDNITMSRKEARSEQLRLCKTGHFYFGNNRTFLLWLDNTRPRLAKKRRIGYSVKEIFLARYGMELDVSIGKESLAIEIENPFRLDIGSMMQRIETFLSSQGVFLDGMDIEGLIPRMVKGIAGCEAGCPADAKSLVSSGYGDFTMEYIEGGILSAQAKIENGKTLHVKMFPDF